MPTLLDSVQAQSFAAPRMTGGPASEPDPTAGGFAALMATPANIGAGPVTKSTKPTSEAVVAVPDSSSATPALLEPAWIANAAATADCEGLEPGESIPHLNVAASGIPPGVASIETPLPFGDPGFPASRLTSSVPTQLERLGEPRFTESDSDLIATSATWHDLVLTLSTIAPGTEQAHVDTTSEHDSCARGAAQAMSSASLQNLWSGVASAGAGQQASPTAEPGSPVASEPPRANEFGTISKFGDNQPPGTEQAVALSLADLLRQEAPAEPSIPLTRVLLPEKTDEQESAPEELMQDPTAATLTETPRATPASSGPERLMKSAPHQTMAGSTAISEASLATQEAIADSAWQPVASPVEEGRRRLAISDKTVPSEEYRMPDLTLGASFSQTDPDPGTTTTTATAAYADSPADAHLQAQIPAAVPEPVLPAVAPSATSTSAGSDAIVRFSASTASTSEANPVERMIAHQVTRAVIKHVGDGDRSLVIRLTPPELGTVRIEFRMQEGRLCAQFHAEDPAVRQALERVLPQLAGHLRQADSPIQQITVGSSASADQAFDGRGFDGRGGQQANRQDQHGNAPRQSRGERAHFSLDGSTAPAAAAPLSPTRVRAPAGLVDTLA